MSMIKRQLDQLNDNSTETTVYYSFQTIPTPKIHHLTGWAETEECHNCKNMGCDYVADETCTCHTTYYKPLSETLPANIADLIKLEMFKAKHAAKVKAGKLASEQRNLIATMRGQCLQGNYEGLKLTPYRMERKQKRRIANGLYIIPVRYKVECEFTGEYGFTKRAFIGTVIKFNLFRWNNGWYEPVQGGV